MPGGARPLAWRAGEIGLDTRWRAITEADLTSALSGPETTAYRSRLTATGQADTLPAVISQVTGEVREAIRSCARNRLTEDAALVPEGLIYHAVAIVRYRLMTRLGMSINDDRKEEWRAATRALERVARCELVVEDIDDPSRVNQPGGVELVGRRTRVATNDLLRGL